MDVRFELAGNTLVWNALKAQASAQKHGVRFEEIASVFLDPLFVLVDATRMSECRCHRLRWLGTIVICSARRDRGRLPAFDLRAPRHCYRGSIYAD